MGWQMVHEAVQWFGELEERSVDVTSPPVVLSECDQLSADIHEKLDLISTLQELLSGAAGSAKGSIGSAIRVQRGLLTKLRNDAHARGCGNVP